MLPTRRFFFVLLAFTSLCLIAWQNARMQSPLRRITNTTEEGISTNPSMSGDGRIVAFESTEDIASAGGTESFRAIRANVSIDPVTFLQMGGSRAPAPGISQDGSRIAFASKDDPLGTNSDQNSEIFLYDGARLFQITNTTPGDIAHRTVNGNFQPSISDDGRFIAFSSNRDLASQNADGNLEAFVFDSVALNFAQLTSSAGTVGFSDAKISGNGSAVAYIRDTGVTPSANRDLLLQNRVGAAPARVLASNVQLLELTYGRAISDDGLRVVWEAETATNSSQVFLYDGRNNLTRKITSLGTRVSEVPLNATINGDGSRIAFATRRTLLGNSDGSVDLYSFDIPSSTLARVTSGPSDATAEVFSSMNDDGSLIAFNFPRVLSGAVSRVELENNSEIYVSATPSRPAFGTLTILNGASFGHEPSTTKAVAPDSVAVARGTALASTTEQSQKQPDGTFPLTLGGTRITVNGRSAQIFFVSPTQVNFHVPPATDIGTAEVIVTNSDGFQSRGNVTTLSAAPGIFTFSGDGLGEGAILNADTLQPGPFDPTNGNLRLIVFSTGVRNGSVVSVTAGGRALTLESIVESADMPGLDEVHALVPADLRGAGTGDLVIRADARDSNSVAVTFAGDASRDIVINEFLSDPPDGTGGDANHDGTRDSGDDEFVELVNTTTHDIDISGYQILTRGGSGSSDTSRFTFPSGTIVPACSAVVVFGGGAFDPNNPVFGGVQVFKVPAAAGLSLTNSNGVITLRDQSSVIVNLVSYGGSTGLNGDANQSLTRSPDATGSFTLHKSAGGSGGRLFSPGTRLNGSAFNVCGSVTRIEVSPSSATIDAGAKQQFTVRAFDTSGQEVFGVIFFWQSSDMAVATIGQNGLATGVSAGSTEIRASGRGVQSAPATLTVRAGAPPLIVISQVYGGGGNTGATYKNDFIEIFNRGTTSVDLAGWSVQQASAAGTSWSVTALCPSGSCLLPPGKYFLVQESSGGVFGADLPTPDASGTSNLAATSGKIALVTNSASLSGSGCPFSPSVIDLVGYGTTADCFEGASHAPPPSATAADLRLAGGCSDTNQNSADFATGTPNPRNTATPANNCGAPSPTPTPSPSPSSSPSPSPSPNPSPSPSPGPVSPVVISEFRTRGPNGASDEFVELYNNSDGAVDISGWKIKGSSNTGAAITNKLTINTGTTLPARGHFLATNSAGYSGSVAGDQTYTSGIANDGGIAVTLPSDTIVDQVGMSSSSAFVEGMHLAPLSSDANQSYERKPGGASGSTQDTDDNFNDFQLLSPSDPQNLASSPTPGGPPSPTPTPSPSPSPTPVSRVDVSPTNANVNRGNRQQFTATAFDQNNQPIPSATFTWTSSDTNIATIDSSGLAKGVGIGSVTITASTPNGQGGTASGTAVLAIQVPILINEALPQVPLDNAGTNAIEGDSNRDGLRSSDDDEFIELLNNSGASVDVSGVIISDSTSNRFTFPANTLLAAGRSTIIFGGGLPAVNDPAFGGALIFTASSLGLTDGADTITVKLPVAATEVTIDTLAYGTGNPVPAPGPESLTRSPDAEVGTAGGSFIAHTTATNAAGRVFSPGTRADGTPFGSPPITRIEVIPVAPRIAVGGTQLFTGHAFNNTGGPEIEILNVSFIWDSSDPGRATLAPTTGQTTMATAVASGTTTIRARAGGQQGTATLSVNPTLSINDVSLNEGNGGTTIFSFTVSLSTAAPAGGVTFDIATQDNTATISDNDYVARTVTSQTIPAGSSTYNFDVTVNGDLTIEPNETFFVNIINISGATVSDGQGQGTILNDDSPTLTINDVSAAETNSGTTTITFTVTSSLPAPAGGITFDIATADGTAQDNNPITEDNDYVAKSLTAQTIAAGNTIYTFDVAVNGDALVEGNETFFVNVTNVSNATVSDGQGQGTIQNDDTANLVISQLYAGGGNAGAQFTNDFVEIFNRGTTTINFAATPYSVQYAGATASFGSSKVDLTSGTMAPGQYFLVQLSGGANGAALPTPDATGAIAMAATAGKVALVAGSTTLTGSGCPLGPTVADFVGYGNPADCFEGSSHVTAPSNTTADLRKAGGCTDTNDNAADFLVSAPFPRNTSSPFNNCAAGTPPNLTINDVTVTEGNSGTTTATFTVSLSAASPSTDTTFDIATHDNTATTANSDYVAKTLTSQVIPAGLQTYTFTVNVNGDVAVEPNEMFFVDVTNAAGAAVTDGQGVGTIQNDDLPSLTINDVALSEGNGGTKILTFTVSLSAAAPATVTFDIATQDSTATVADNDYLARTLASETIPAGSSTYNFDVTVNGDLTIEPNETFFVNITNISGATVSDGQAVGTIQNDDSPTLTINDVTAAETNSGTTTFTFTVTSSLPAPAGGISFDIATADGTAQDDNPAATEDNDYAPKSLSGQIITAGNTTYNFDVTVNGDTLVEATETFFVNITNVSNATISGGQGQGTIENDDAANLVISQLYGGGGNAGATYLNDFIEVFNRGTTAVNLSGWSVQYASATGTTWQVTNLSGTLQPGQYYLVQEGSGGANGSPLPTPDAAGTIAMAAGAGKVALLNSTTALTGACPSSVSIFDLVGYGANANCFEGSGPAPAASANTADARRVGGCTDTNDNAADFLALPPAPRNTASPLNDCNAVPPNLTIDDVTIAEGNGGPVTATFTVSLSIPAPSAGVTFDIATQDNSATVADNDYANHALTGQTITPGNQTFSFSVIVNGDTNVEPNETFFVNVTNVNGANVVDDQGLGTINNDDSTPLPNLTIDDASTGEGNGGTTTFTFTVSLSAPAPTAGVTFDIATADGTAQDDTPATEDNDYVLKALTSQTITSGNTIYIFGVTVNGDTVVEPNETFTVNVTNITGANPTDTLGQATIQNDDGANVVISQIYGAGGNAGATHQNDFIEIFNRSTAPVNLTGWSVQYAGATGTSWQVTNLSGTLQPGQYYLIQQAGGANGIPLPAPDATGTISMAAGAGKVALLSVTTALSGACPSSANIMDFVGYGATANCFQGAGPTPAPSTTNSANRAASGCTDSGNNNTDFTAASVAPRNTSSLTHSCP